MKAKKDKHLSFFRKKIISVIPLSQVVVLVLLCMMVTTGTAWARSIHLQTAFDNTVVDMNEPRNRFLELLITAPGQANWRESERLPLNICLVVDRSGSMNDYGKINYVKEAARKILSLLRPGDRFSIVTYNERAQVLIPSRPMKELHWARKRISEIDPGGGTNIEAGLIAGYKQVQRYYSPRFVNRLMLLSDGLANRGMVSLVQLGELVQYQADNDISLSTFGVGLDFNEDLMAALSENGRGMYNYIEHPNQIASMLQREFQLCGQVVATGIKLEIHLRKGVRVEKVMANKYRLHGRNLVIQVGDLSAGERRRYQIRLFPPALSTGQQKMGNVAMSYTVAGQGRRMSDHVGLYLQYRRDVEDIYRYSNRQVEERSAVFEAHYARDEAAKAVDIGNIEQAQAILATAAKQIQGKKERSARLREEARLINSYSESLRKSPGKRARKRLQKAVKFDKHALEGC